MRLGLIGFGAIGRALAPMLRAAYPEAELFCLTTLRAAQDAAVQAVAAEQGVRLTTSLPELIAAKPALVCECAGHAALAEAGVAVLEAGVPLVAASTGALADDALYATLRGAARRGGTRMILTAGAIGAVDVLAALGKGGIRRLDYSGVKPPAAWAGTPADGPFDLGALEEATVIFSGSAREAARNFPKNANVAATLALAGPGFEETHVTLIADPGATGNSHVVEVQAEAARFRFEIEGVPSKGNAKTSQTTVLGLFREIRNLLDEVAI